jgi:activator of 2-hydroxyglutaryl-CoA dehydratase
MNGRCAAGAGRFLEVMATALSYPMRDFVQADRRRARRRSLGRLSRMKMGTDVGD